MVWSIYTCNICPALKPIMQRVVEDFQQPLRFDNLIVVLDAPGNEDKVIGLEFVKSRLLQEEQRESMKTTSTASSHALALVNRMPIRRDMKCTKCNRHGHTAARSWGKDVNGRRPASPDGYRSRNIGIKPIA